MYPRMGETLFENFSPLSIYQSILLYNIICFIINHVLAFSYALDKFCYLE